MRRFRKELDMVNGARQLLVLTLKEFVLDKSHENGIRKSHGKICSTHRPLRDNE